jgi:hypothetical protein
VLPDVSQEVSGVFFKGKEVEEEVFCAEVGKH